MTQFPAWTLVLNLTAGLVLGGAYFSTLRWTSDRLATGRGLKATVAVIVARFALLGGALTLTSLMGALPLLLTALGVLIARAVVLRRAGAVSA